MPPTELMENGRSGFEKHAQTAIQVILVALTLWVGSAVVTLQNTSVRLEERNVQLRDSISSLQVEVTALRLAVAAGNERGVDNKYQIQDVQSRVNTLERRILSK